MKVEKINAQEVFKDNNEGLIFGLQEVSDFPAYIEWFKTEEEREEVIKLNKMKCIN
jgi:hypothetical protein